MTVKHALPGLIAGALGLIVGVIGFVTEQPFAGVLAGLLAFTGAGVSVRLASRLEDEALLRSRLDDAEQRAATTGPTDMPEPAAPPATTPAAVEAGDASEPTGTALAGEAGGPDGFGANHDADRDAAHQEPSRTDEGGFGAELDRAASEPMTGEGAEGLIDHATGLFSEEFFHVSLETRVAAARRHLRPVAVVLIDVVRGLPADEPIAVDPFVVSDVLKETLREADTACRLHNGYFALLLEDTPENGAIWTVERIRRQLVATRDGLTVWAGIACYPAHAFTPEGILDAADEALIAAREWRQDRIEVAATAE